MNAAPTTPVLASDAQRGNHCEQRLVQRPLLRYFGGKWQLRHWIIKHFPAHRVYAEPFAGAASVLLSKAPAPDGEILNDLNGDTMNLFRVMQNREQADELQRRLDWTPYAKAELELSRQSSEDPIERARRMVIRSFMGIEVAGVRGTASGFRMGNVDLGRRDQDGSRTFRNTGRDWSNWKLHYEADGEVFERVNKMNTKNPNSPVGIKNKSLPSRFVRIIQAHDYAHYLNSDKSRRVFDSTGRRLK